MSDQRSLTADIRAVREYHHPTWLTDRDVARLLGEGASGAGPRKATPRQVREAQAMERPT